MHFYLKCISVIYWHLLLKDSIEHDAIANYVSVLNMVRKSLVYSLIVFGLTFTTPNTARAASAGAKCTKSGKVEITKGTSYTCTKVGKNLKWVKTRTQGTGVEAILVMANAKEGSACALVGSKSRLLGGYLECRSISGGLRKWVKLSNSPSAISIPDGGANLEECKLKEARINRFQSWNVGFPRGGDGTSMLSTAGVSKVQLIAVDFPDAAGTESELNIAQDQIAEFNRWFDFTSNGSKSFSWQFQKRWFRMSKNIGDYGLRYGDRNSTLPMAQEMVNISDSSIDYSNSDFVFVLLPKSNRLLVDGIGAINWPTISNEGPVTSLWGGGDYFYRNNYNIWEAWVHEIGHTMGLPGHSPWSNLSMMANQNGNSVMLNVWDTFFAGWYGSDELYCLPSTATRFESKLIPLERLQRGMRGIVIPISSTEGLVVESHRAEGWGSRLGNGNYGVLVYYVDTTKDTDRSGEQQGIVKEAWSKYITPPVTNKFNLLLQGDSVSYKGLTVKVVATGDNDTVLITR